MSPRQRTMALLAGGFFLASLLAVVAAFRSCDDPPRAPDTLRAVVRRHQNIEEPPRLQRPRPEPAGGSCTLSGSTIDDVSGTRVAGIVVHAHSHQSGEFVADAVSDSSGTYRMELPEGPHSLQWFVVHEDGTSVSRLGTMRVDVIGERVLKDLHFDLYPFVVVEGVVLDSGVSPIKDAKVMAHFAGPWKPEWNDKAVFARTADALKLTSVSREDGSFTLSGMLYPARYWMHAAHPAYVPFNGEYTGIGFTVVAGHGQRSSCTIHMRPEDFILLKGRLIAREGTPIPDASVTLRNGPLQHQVRSDADGRFSSNVRPAPVTVIARHADYRCARQELKSIPRKPDPRTAVEDVVLVMDRKTLRVTVTGVDERGHPVDATLILLEMDSSNPDLNPDFEVLMREGKAQFHADEGVRHLFSLPPDSPFILSSLTRVGDPTLPSGSLLDFESQRSEVRIVLKRR